MVRKTGFILSAVFLVMFIFVGCSTIPLDEGKRHEGTIVIDYHFAAQGTTTDGLGVKFTWDIITQARRYRVIFGNTIDTVFPAYEVVSGDTTYFNSWTLNDAQQLGTYTVLFSRESSGNVWSADTVGRVSTTTKSGSSHMVAYGLNGNFAAIWDENTFEVIGFGNSQLHSIAEVYLYDPCDSLDRIDTTVFIIDSTFIDTLWVYDTTIVTDTALAFLQINSAFNPPFSGGKQAGIYNVGSDSSWAELRIAPIGDQYLYTTPIVMGDIVWLQSTMQRYLKISVDSIYMSPPASDLDSAVIYFRWNYQPVPKLRYVY
ncbi:hypothetical protein JXL83_03390 [candidate division WOR-3 bacterium]|nr:hypothetical protein [candidate division WOR-3 bacterium]